MENDKSKQRLSKVLASAGVASRRACEEIIFSGRVSVNGEVTIVPQAMVAFDQDKITVDGKAIKQEESKYYFMLNKPEGYICTNARHSNRTRLVVDLFNEVPARLFTIGRLDKDTEGLILVTNDGAFAQNVIHPSSNIHKEYIAKTNREITDAHLKIISKGTEVEGIFVKPVWVKKVRKGTVKVVVAEGKKHEVRLLLENAGLGVRYLKRTRIGGLPLGTLPKGSWRPLNKREREQIFQS